MKDRNQYSNPNLHNHVHLHSNTRSNNLLGVAATVIGIIACLFAWIPFIGILTIPIASIGILLAIIGFVLALATRMSIISAICGLLTCIVAFAIGYANVKVSDTILNGPEIVNENSKESSEDAFESSSKTQHATRTVMPSMDMEESEANKENDIDRKEKQAVANGETEQDPDAMFAERMSKALFNDTMDGTDKDKEETISQTSKKIQLGQKIELENVVFTIKNMEWKEEIHGTDKACFQYIKDNPDEINIVFHVELKNMSGDSVSFTDIPAQITFNKKFKYNCHICKEGDLDTFYNTKPLKKEPFLFWASVPNEISEIWQNVELKFGLNEDLSWKRDRLDEVDSVFLLTIQK